MTRPDILIYAPTATGGLAEHGFQQAHALARKGARVVCLTSPAHLDGRPFDVPVLRSLLAPASQLASPFLRKISLGLTLCVNQGILFWQILRLRPRLVLLDSYTEYLSPLWIWPHVLLARGFGVPYLANLHDPVRSHRIGPWWWHGLSVRLAYLPLSFVAVHGKLPEPSPVPPSVGTVTVPHGLFSLAAPTRDRGELRSDWGVKAEQRVFLAFGYIRDGKNLHLAIEALARVEDAVLVIRGTVASNSDRTTSSYRELARGMGVADRVIIEERFTPDDEVGTLFSAVDFVLLSYASSFHSQSGVLQLAVAARKPVLASAAPSPLLDSVREFSLGASVPPDSAEAIAAGMRQMIRQPVVPHWDDYERAASWDTNAERIIGCTPLGAR